LLHTLSNEPTLGCAPQKLPKCKESLCVFASSNILSPSLESGISLVRLPRVTFLSLPFLG
jgi:hypothetical protein